MTRTPFTANLFGYVSVCLATSRWELPQRTETNFLSQRKRGTFSLCACVLLPVSAAPRQIPLRSMDDPPVSLSLRTTTRSSRFCVTSPFCFIMGREGTHNPPKNNEAAFRSVQCWCWFRLGEFGYDLIRGLKERDFDTLNCDVPKSLCLFCPLKIGYNSFFLSL